MKQHITVDEEYKLTHTELVDKNSTALSFSNSTNLSLSRLLEDSNLQNVTTVENHEQLSAEQQKEFDMLMTEHKRTSLVYFRKFLRKTTSLVYSKNFLRKFGKRFITCVS
ncbi:hypothetical protein QQ045_012473 [Rhodiola kirilowii]